MPSFENADGSFFTSTAVNVQVSVSAATITAAWNDRSIFIANATVYASQTVLLPKRVEHGDFFRIASLNDITALTIQDGFAVAVTGAPLSMNAGQAITLRYVNATVGWVLWEMGAPAHNVQYLEMTSTGAAPIISATFLQAGEMVINMIGAMAADAALTLPSVANFVPHLPRGFSIGATFKLRIINSSSAAHVWTVTTNSGWTVTGTTLTIAQNTWRDFIVSMTSATAAVLKPAGIGTFS